MSTTDLDPPSLEPPAWRPGRDGTDRSGKDRHDRAGLHDMDDGGDWRWHDHSPLQTSRGDGLRGWLVTAESWMDDRGKGAWIAAMVLAFIFVWPVGLALLAYLIWSKRMFSRSCSSRHRGHDHRSRHDSFRAARAAMRPSGNVAFDAYKTETLRRLEDEQKAFEDFLSRLRGAKDKAEFDDFMDERARRPQDNDAGPETDGEPARP